MRRAGARIYVCHDGGTVRNQGRDRVEFVAFALLLIASIAPSAGFAAKSDPDPEFGIEHAVRMVEGVRLEIRSNTAFPVKGKYLIALNYMPSHMEKKPPYRSMLMTVDGTGKIDLLAAYDSKDLRTFITDFKPLPDGLYSYALNRARGPRWSYQLRFMDPKSGADVRPPASYPLSDPELDGHETITYVGDRRLFLFYRDRKEGGKEYIDNEIQSISASTGAVVGKWSSRHQFPPEMESDYLHINSLFPMSPDRVLASARTTSTLYVINLATGRLKTGLTLKRGKSLTIRRMDSRSSTRLSCCPMATLCSTTTGRTDCRVCAPGPWNMRWIGKLGFCASCGSTP